jgi:flagellin
MAINDVSLTAGMRSNLLSLQGTVDLLNRTQNRLSTGKKVNSAIDSPMSFFAAQALTSRASDIDSLKDGMGQAIQTIQAADKGINGLTALIQSAKSVATSALSATTVADITSLTTQYSTILSQITNMATDSGYAGKNLLAAATLTVQFEGSNTLAVTGFAATVGGLSITTGGAWTTTGTTEINAAITSLDNAITTLRQKSSSLAGNLSIITVRQEFSTNMINTLTAGSDKLTLADANEEGANMLMLQTRQTLSTTALSLSAQAAQSVLRLFQ